MNISNYENYKDIRMSEYRSCSEILVQFSEQHLSFKNKFEHYFKIGDTEYKVYKKDELSDNNESNSEMFVITMIDYYFNNLISQDGKILLPIIDKNQIFNDVMIRNQRIIIPISVKCDSQLRKIIESKFLNPSFQDEYMIIEEGYDSNYIIIYEGRSKYLNTQEIFDFLDTILSFIKGYSILGNTSTSKN